MRYNRAVGVMRGVCVGTSALLTLLCAPACADGDGTSGRNETITDAGEHGAPAATSRGDAANVDSSSANSRDAGVDADTTTEVEIPVEVIDGADEEDEPTADDEPTAEDSADALPPLRTGPVPDLFSGCQAGNSDPGVTWFRRLTAWQLDNTLRDLFGVDSMLRWIPADAQVGQFYNNAPSEMTTELADRYASLASSVARILKPRMAEFSPCDLEAAGDDIGCAELFISELGLKVYRRPLTFEEIASYVDLYTLARQQRGEASAGFEWVVRTMLQSPHFLYNDDANIDFSRSQALPLDSFGMASRLSYFLWQSTPDDELLRAAAAGELLDDATLQSQTLRMLSDPRAERMIRSFFVQWLELQRLPEQTKVDERWTPALAWDMVDEIATLGGDVILRGDGSLATLFTTTQSAASDELLSLYGTSREADAARVTLDPSERAGLLTRAAFLARYATPERSSPTHRGLWVQSRLLCTPFPGDVGHETIAPPTDDQTTRQWVETQTSMPQCTACHVFFDPIGFNLENYDAIGAHRTTQNGEPIDATGELVADAVVRQATQNAFELSANLPSLPTTNRCVAMTWWRFALGRSGDSFDGASISALEANFQNSNGNLLALIQCLVSSPAFRSVRWEGTTVR